MIAYLSMEIALDAAMPTYAGGLGVLAGDAMHASADLGLPLCGVTIAWRKGYFRQRLEAGRQVEEPDGWDPAARLQRAADASVELEGRTVRVRAWRAVARGARGEVPVYFLDTDLPENDPRDRTITNALYGGTDRDRLRQEAVLGLGGMAVLRAVGIEPDVVHLNEGHAALAGLAPTGGGRAPRCVFTTHTPVPAGHDRFPLALVRDLFGDALAARLEAAGSADGWLDMTRLALAISRYVNAVSRRHSTLARRMFPGRAIDAITNGAHAPRWAAPAFAELYDRRLPGWREDNDLLRGAAAIPPGEIRGARAECKRALVAEVARRTGVALDPHALTLGFARRAAAYKRMDLCLYDPERLRRIARAMGPIQIVFAGKAHPHDDAGKALLTRVHAVAAALAPEVRAVYLENYDLALAALLIAGADLWLNTPQRPLEASGTSGMKAAVNGVPSLSVLDGWWVEGCVEGETGWAIGGLPDEPGDDATEAASLYDQLERVVASLYARDPDGFARVGRGAIARNASHFHAQRMMREYAARAYAS